MVAEVTASVAMVLLTVDLEAAAAVVLAVQAAVAVIQAADLPAIGQVIQIMVAVVVHTTVEPIGLVRRESAWGTGKWKFYLRTNVDITQLAYSANDTCD